MGLDLSLFGVPALPSHHHQGGVGGISGKLLTADRGRISGGIRYSVGGTSISACGGFGNDGHRAGDTGGRDAQAVSTVTQHRAATSQQGFLGFIVGQYLLIDAFLLGLDLSHMQGLLQSNGLLLQPFNGPCSFDAALPCRETSRKDGQQQKACDEPAPWK